MNDTVEPESHDSQQANEPHLNWNRKVPQGEDATPEEADPFLGVTNEMFLDALDAMVRKKVARDSKVDFPITVMRVRKQLDSLYGIYLRRGDLGKAFGVLREQIRLLSLENHIQPLTESDLRDERRDPYSHAVQELDPKDLHQVNKRREALDAELRREVFEKTNRNPDGSRISTPGPADPVPNPRRRPSGPDA